MKHLHGSRVLLVVDPDVDGYTSSAVVWLYMTNYLQGYKDFNFTLEYHIPEGKEHGLEVVFDELFPEKKYDLIICPDSSSNDYPFHKVLKEVGYDILVLDHHEADHYSSDAVVINN
jgi:single-stranded DNA-specific DHH superfamily exonuclease